MIVLWTFSKSPVRTGLGGGEVSWGELRWVEVSWGEVRLKLVGTWTVKVAGATHSVCPYPSTMTQPRAHRMNVSTDPASGADPTTRRRMRPPMLSWTLPSTSLSQMVLLRMMPRRNSFSLELSAALNRNRFNDEWLNPLCTLSKILYER